MPLIRTQSSQNPIEQEGRVLLAIQVIKNQEICAIREAARIFKAPETSLRRRLNSSTTRAETRSNSHKLTKIEEEPL
jgi:hypothetical protein